MTRKCIVFPLIVAAVAAIGVTGLAKDTAVLSQWAAAPVKIDGLEQDWQDALFLIDEGSKAQYAVKNDGHNLYLLFVFKDQKSSTTIEYTGMKIFFNAEGKKSKDLGISFTRKALTADALIAAMEKRGETLTEERKAEIRKRKTYLIPVEDLINEKKLTAPADPAVQNEPPAYRTAGKQPLMIYEFRIPLSRINQPGGIGSEPGKTIKLGFEWGGMTREIMKNMMADRASAGAQALERGISSASGFGDLSGEGEGGFDSGMGMPGSGIKRDPLGSKHSFWLDVKLAEKTS
jgi:hypothetical protein